jgi:hypothetical protein
MPRTSRFSVEFPDAIGQWWEARFTHQHNEDDGIPVFVNERMTSVQHVTTCHLSLRDDKNVVVGRSMCSLKDKYNWKHGIKFALADSLQTLGLCKISRNAKGNKIITPLSPMYWQMVQSFFAEMKVMAYAPHIQPVDGVVDAVLVGEVPAENQMGLAHTGMD